MKRIITLALTLSAIMVAMAMDNYYYSGHVKRYFDIDSTAVVIFSSSYNNYCSLPSHGSILTQKCSRDDFHVRVYELSSTMSYFKLNKFLSQDTIMSMMPCIIKHSGKRLTTNGEISVKLFNTSDTILLVEHCKEFGCTFDREPIIPYWYSLRIIPGCRRNPIDIANRLYESGCYDYVEPDLCVENMEEVSYDPSVNRQWALYNHLNENHDISVSRAWNYATGRGITIAIIDSGIDLMHKDLSENIDSLSFDAESNSSPSKRYSDHGTFCAGVIGAVRNNNIHIAGVAPDAKLMSISFDKNKQSAKSIQ